MACGHVHVCTRGAECHWICGNVMQQQRIQAWVLLTHPTDLPVVLQGMNVQASDDPVKTVAGN